MLCCVVLCCVVLCCVVLCCVCLFVCLFVVCLLLFVCCFCLLFLFVVFVRGLFSAKVPNSSFAEVRMGLLIEATHMEDESEEQEHEKKMREMVKSAE